MRSFGTVLARSAAITAIAVIATLVAFVVMRWIGGERIQAEDWIETLIIPVLVGFPISAFVVAQADQLRTANAQLVSLSEERSRAHRQLQEAHDLIAHAGRHDRMTGLLNREGFMEELARSHQTLADAVLLIADVDFFKTINDRFGHHEGDMALIAVAQALGRAVRPGDLVGRIGGEEFGILLKGLSIGGAADASERIRSEVAQTEWAPAGGAKAPLTVSIGGAAICDCPGSVTTLMIEADKCLYEAKRRGRNRIAFHPGLSDVAHAMASVPRRSTLQ